MPASQWRNKRGALNFASFRSATQSSTWDGGQFPAQLAIDGNLDDWSCAISELGDFNPWWKVELAYPIWVTHLELTNRRVFGRLNDNYIA